MQTGSSLGYDPEFGVKSSSESEGGSQRRKSMVEEEIKMYAQMTQEQRDEEMKNVKDEIR